MTYLKSRYENTQHIFLNVIFLRVERYNFLIVRMSQKTPT